MTDSLLNVIPKETPNTSRGVESVVAIDRTIPTRGLRRVDAVIKEGQNIGFVSHATAMNKVLRSVGTTIQNRLHTIIQQEGLCHTRPVRKQHAAHKIRMCVRSCHVGRRQIPPH